jgi:hypothetical protein
MLIAVPLELLARPGRFANVQGWLAARGMPHPIRSLRARAGRLRRYLEVTTIAGRHGLTPSSALPAHLLPGAGLLSRASGRLGTAGLPHLPGMEAASHSPRNAGGLHAALGRQPPIRRTSVADLVATGESQTVESKSTARWNLRSGATDKRLEHVIVKTVCEFFNAEGGPR